LDSLSWWSVIQLALTTGITTTLLTVGVNSWRERSNTNTEAAYLALRIVVILEQFVRDCVYRMLSDKIEVERSQGTHYLLPDLADYPPDAHECKSFYTRSLKLAGQVLSFPADIKSAENLSGFQSHYEGNPFGLVDEVIIAGFKAWKIAKSIRDKYGLGVNPIPHVGSLEVAHVKLEERLATYRAQRSSK
jgi:hypothetical protein